AKTALGERHSQAQALRFLDCFLDAVEHDDGADRRAPWRQPEPERMTLVADRIPSFDGRRVAWTPREEVVDVCILRDEPVAIPPGPIDATGTHQAGAEGDRYECRDRGHISGCDARHTSSNRAPATATLRAARCWPSRRHPTRTEAGHGVARYG